MRSLSFGVALASVVVAAPLSAQTWQAIGTPTNTPVATSAYWNNQSFGSPAGVVCNVGAVLTNTPVSPASCPNQHAISLPLTPTPLTQSNLFLGGTSGSEPGVGGFRFAAGTYNIKQIGSVAAVGVSPWGIVLDNPIGSKLVYTAAELMAGPVTLGGPFSIWIVQALPFAGPGMVFTSDRRVGATAIATRGATINQQFAVFTNGTGLGTLGGLSADAFGTIINATSAGATYYVGMEDLANGGRGFGAGPGVVSDRDYQDVLISIQAVPEPATVALMGFGLLALAGIAKRRNV